MREIESLSVGAIDWLIEGISKLSKLRTGKFGNKDGFCALGAIGFTNSITANYNQKDELACRAHEVGLMYYVKEPHEREKVRFTNAVGSIVFQNDNYKGTDKGRKEYMLHWLQTQRDMKCSDWVPPAKELSADERRRKVVCCG